MSHNEINAYVCGQLVSILDLLQFVDNSPVFSIFCSLWTTRQYSRSFAVCGQLVSILDLLQFVDNWSVFSILCSLWTTRQYSRSFAVCGQFVSILDLLQFVDNSPVFSIFCSLWTTRQYSRSFVGRLTINYHLSANITRLISSRNLKEEWQVPHVG